jgi:branched-chain amino acid transport system permease protein
MKLTRARVLNLILGVLVLSLCLFYSSEILSFIITSKEYLIHLLILVCIYLILAQGFNLNFGVGMLFNLAHVAAYAVGAYTTALLATDYSFSFVSCLLLSMLLAGVFSFLLGAISLKLSTDYFAIGTLAFSSVVSALLINWKSLTRGVLGIPGIPRPVIGGEEYIENTDFLFLIAAVVVLVQIVMWCVFRSPFSRALRAQAEFSHAASALGKNVALARNYSFFIASALAGLAGSFFAYYINYIDPSSFALHEMIFVLTIVAIGRPGSFWGCIIACFFLVLLPEPLRFIDIPPSILGPMRQMIYAVILFTVVFINRARIFPVQRKV